MADAIAPPAGSFPSENSLCERCGYPLKGLATDAACPECGLAVVESSPAKRSGLHKLGLPFARLYPRIAVSIFLRPKRFFRAMPVNGDNKPARYALALNAVLAGLVWAFVWGTYVERDLFAVHAWAGGAFAVIGLTYIEMLGVCTFSKRRGWRVPFALAERVCCYVSIAWLPGMMLAGIGMAVIDQFALGQPWFEQLLGLVRVGWLIYAGLFVASLLWFETLVWIGVRQVRYANAWPESEGPVLGQNAIDGPIA